MLRLECWNNTNEFNNDTMCNIKTKNRQSLNCLLASLDLSISKRPRSHIAHLTKIAVTAIKKL